MGTDLVAFLECATEDRGVGGVVDAPCIPAVYEECGFQFLGFEEVEEFVGDF